LLGEVIRLILSAYFEPTFSDHSHGFREGRGCHTALREIYYGWSGTTWFVEGDISGCFNNLAHELILAALSEHIHDGRFIHLIRQLLKAGYLENWKFNRTLSGVPQGSVVSPILSNILLDRLDKFVETVLIPKYTKGVARKRNPDYQHLMGKAERHHRKGEKAQASMYRKQAQKLPSVDTHDPDFRRLRYCRYADDWLLGFIGPKAEAQEIKQQLETFLREELHLELSKTKTLITHARSQAARFLGYDITTLQKNAKRTKNMARGTKGRSVNGRIGLRVPPEVLKATLNDHPPHQMMGRTELEKRLLAQRCEQCGATSLTAHIEVHHIRALKDLEKYPGREKPRWVKIMAARRRKTLVLCRTCHQDVQYGRPLRRQQARS
jgi:retron-type reverse transcriptase